MSTTTTSSRTSGVRWLMESRPPSLTWSRSSPPQPNQPPLDLTDQDVSDAAAAVLDHRGVRVSLVKAGWAATQRPGLPDAREWSTDACAGADSGAAGPAAGCSSHSLEMCLHWRRSVRPAAWRVDHRWDRCRFRCRHVERLPKIRVPLGTEEWAAFAVTCQRFAHRGVAFREIPASQAMGPPDRSNPQRHGRFVHRFDARHVGCETKGSA